MAEGGELVLVVGAGIMGHGIAQVAAMSGYRAVLSDANPEALEHGLARVRANLDKGVARGKVTAETRDRALANLRGEADSQLAASEACFIIEAVPERMDLKKRLLAQLDEAAPPEAILGTNTSSLSITEIASATGRPERVIGTHFFNPPHIVRLLELVRAVQTSASTLERTRAFGERLGREVIVVADSPGFATSRLGLVLGLEAIRMVEAGVASVEDIDQAMRLGYRHPVGPLELTDLVGLDTRLKIAEHLHRELGGDRFHPPPLLRQMVRAGKLGKKSGEGFYRW